MDRFLVTGLMMIPTESPYKSYIISWNLTRLCNLKCEHCYIDAGPLKKALLSDELSTDECYRVIDQIVEVNPEALLILTGGEPLLRSDVFDIAAYAGQKGLWPVVGTNGVKISRRLAQKMKDSGIKGVSLSLDSLDPQIHDHFRGVEGAWQNTVSGSKILEKEGLPFIVQTTIHQKNRSEISEIARFAHTLGARVFNLYFLVSTGRGSYVSDVSPEEYESAMRRLIELQKEFDGKMIVNSKCAPHYQQILYEQDPSSKFLKSYSLGAGGCPAGTHYLGIRPNGDMTPCPYLPVYGGNLRNQSFKSIWETSEVFQKIRQRNKLGGRCGECEFSGVCGGCRARAYGKTGDFMAEDPWCMYQPGLNGGKKITFEGKTTYGDQNADDMSWTPEALERLKKIPSFVRGMVSRRIENYARERGYPEITSPLMSEIREKMGNRIGGAPSFVRKFLDRT